MRIQLALGRRSWSWLARQASIRQSTLASQAAKPKFSVVTLVQVARALDRPIGYFLPGPDASGAMRRAADDALAQIDEIIARAREEGS
jgi:hypothetical protein